MFNRTVIRELPLETIKEDLATFGFRLTDEHFARFTYSELNKLYRKAEKAYRIRCSVAREIKEILSAPAPAEEEGE